MEKFIRCFFYTIAMLLAGFISIVCIQSSKYLCILLELLIVLDLIFYFISLGTGSLLLSWLVLIGIIAQCVLSVFLFYSTGKVTFMVAVMFSIPSFWAFASMTCEMIIKIFDINGREVDRILSVGYYLSSCAFTVGVICGVLIGISQLFNK